MDCAELSKHVTDLLAFCQLMSKNYSKKTLVKKAFDALKGMLEALGLRVDEAVIFVNVFVCLFVCFILT